MALWVTAYAIAAAVQGAEAGIPSKTAGPVSAELERAAPARESIPASAVGGQRMGLEVGGSGDRRPAAALGLTLAARDAGVDRIAEPVAHAVAETSFPATAASGHTDLMAWLGKAPMPVGWAFVLASIGVMTSIARRRHLD